MCSIGGFIASKPIKADHAHMLCRALLHYGSIRGDQSAGVFVDGRLFKRAESPTVLPNFGGFSDLFDRPVSFALTHTRQPTSGGVGDAQAQPFKLGNTVTVHNGFFDTDVKKQWNIKKKSGVDSELITSFVHQYGPKLLHKFVKSTVGPSAIAAYHEGQLYLMSAGNPIHILKFTIDKIHVLAFASTADILESALKTVWLMPVGLNAEKLTEDRLYSADAAGIRRLSKDIKRPMYGYGGAHYYQGKWSGHTYTGKDYDSSKFPDRDNEKRYPNIVHNYNQKEDNKETELQKRLKEMGYDPETGTCDGGND